jgi:hypothetical protein
MKRSKAVPLLMLGTLGLLAGCGSDSREIQTRQNNYRSVEDCRKDWGNDEKDCQRSSSRAGGYAYVGPRYIWNHGAGYPMAVNSDGSQRQLTNSYLSRPGAASTATSATVSRSTFSSNTSSSGARSSGSSVSRGGFGSTARGFSGGG